jgi:Sulfocyanin (SoxE) domain
MMKHSCNAAAVLTILLGSACSSAGQSAARSPAPEDSSRSPSPPTSTRSAPPGKASPVSTHPDWIKSDSAARQVTLSLETAVRPESTMASINGYRNGEARVVVPVGWTVTWNWRNADASAAHSLVVMVQREKIPVEGGRAAFSNAMTRMVTQGLDSGQTDQSTFQADEAGWYWLLCGVPSHALNGEWIELRVDPDAKKPDLVVKGHAPS